MRWKTGLVGTAVILVTMGLATVYAADPQDGDSGGGPTTAAGHAAAASSYEAEAKQAKEKAVTHQLTATRYKNAPVLQKGLSVPTAPMVQHCQKLADSYNQVASEAASLAQIHRDSAKSAGD